MTSNKTMQKQRALLVFAFQQEKESEKQRRLRELSEIVRSCGGEVATCFRQNLSHYHPATLIGKGKVQEIATFVEENAIDVVVFEQELSGAQRLHLSEEIPCRVLDRVDLILDIFALRAQTKKAKVDVELAQLAYRLPNLRGYGKDLSRTGGGIGTRGPGEQKLETDRRSIEQRMKRLRQQRSRITAQERESGKRRRQSSFPIVGLVGYTNAGKSTIMNALISLFGEKEKEVYADDRLFATLEVSMRRIAQPGKKAYLLADTIGFIHDLPKKLTAPFASTLEEIRYADLLLHVVDAAEEGANERIETVQNRIRSSPQDIPVLYVLNKIDLGDDSVMTPPEQTIRISAKCEEDIFRLQERIQEVLAGETKLAEKSI
ncbi:GTPase HflX [Murdochiella massiliensis]|uniref:GTPase HflX n=1 Tax=Murdochiella massiliensis TaxID=1673723 RepID=UPI0008341CB6|nr:GTPase HflX [Murdochiella massiliensis]